MPRKVQTAWRGVNERQLAGRYRLGHYAECECGCCILPPLVIADEPLKMSRVEKAALLFSRTGPLLTLDEVGKIFGVTKARIQQIEQGAFRKIIKQLKLLAAAEGVEIPESFRRSSIEDFTQ
jgi:sigma-70-like protein